MQFGENTSETPHVDGHAVFGAEYDFWCAIESTLNVRVDSLVIVATGTVVDDFDAAASLLLEQNVLRLEIAVNDAIPMEHFETLEYSVRKLPHELKRKTLKFVLLDQFVEIDREQFECDARVISKGEMIEHVNDVVSSVVILLLQMLQYAYLLLRLTREALLVSNHLERDVLLPLVIVDLENLPETALAENFEHFVAIEDVIVRYVYVRSRFVVVAAILRAADHALTLFRRRPDEIDLRVIEDFVVFVRCQFMHVEFHCLLGTHCRAFRCRSRVASRFAAAAAAATRGSRQRRR